MRIAISCMPSCLLLLSLMAAPAAQAASDEDEWLASLYDRIGADLAAGKPLVVHAHVPLCDNQIIRCGGHGLGNGESAQKNLYWATSGGFRGWFGRRGAGWSEVRVERNDALPEDVLDVRVWKRRIRPERAWRSRGVREAFDVYMVAYAWRGAAIRNAMDAYVADLFGREPREITLADGTRIAAGGAAHVVAYVGHNGWMDVDEYDWSAAQEGSDAPAKGTIAVACITESYLAPRIASRARVPLLMTKTLLFAGAHSVEGAVSAFARARSLADIRQAAATAYAQGQGKTVRKVWSAFTNPSDPRWMR